jgi:hypothetical protein
METINNIKNEEMLAVCDRVELLEHKLEKLQSLKQLQE